jgi:hypothetical protein
MMMVTQALWFFDFLVMEVPRADSRTNWETEERVRVVCFLLFEVCGGFWARPRIHPATPHGLVHDPPRANFFLLYSLVGCMVKL